MGETETKAPEQQVADAAAGARAAVTAISDLLDQLVPPETVEISDVFGGRHVLRGRLPARSQVLVVRQMEAVFAAEVGAEIRAAVGSGGYGAALVLLARAAADERVLGGLASAFATAHPAAVARAEAAARASGETAIRDAADLFGVEEMAAAILPFCLAPLRRMAGVMRDLLAG